MSGNWPGYYIGFEGGEGGGKSTQLRALHDRLGEFYSDKKILVTREPGGTDLGEKIRETIFDQRWNETTMNRETEMHLFAAARIQLIKERIMPILNEGGIVLSDRSFYSSLAFQGQNRHDFELVREVNRLAVGPCVPDLVYLLDLPVETGLGRIKGRKENNTFDLRKASFHQRVRHVYRLMAFLSFRFELIDATLPKDEVGEKIWEAFHRRYEGLQEPNWELLMGRR